MHSKQERRAISKSLVSSPLTQNEVNEHMKKSGVTSSVVIGSSHDIKQHMLAPSNFSPAAKQLLVPDFARAGKRDTIFSTCSRAKTIIGHYDGRPDVNEKRFESPQVLIENVQMGWTGARPRKIAYDINFTKPTNRDGAKIILMKSISPLKKGFKYATQPLSPFESTPGFG